MIHESIQHLALPLELLVPLENNPRKGNVQAIAASYSEFGQIKPIVVRPNDDGTYTVIAGNHQLQAAKSLGWPEIASVQMKSDDARAIAFALADNRTMELGSTDESMVLELLSQIDESYGGLMDSLQWDEFEIAALTEHSNKYGGDEDYEGGYVPPVFVAEPLTNADISFDKVTGDTVITAKPGVDSNAAAAMGSTAIDSSGSTKAVVQYTLVFDSSDQQRHWYDFIRFLRSSTVYEGATTAERLMMFIDAHGDF